MSYVYADTYVRESQLESLQRYSETHNTSHSDLSTGTGTIDMVITTSVHNGLISYAAGRVIAFVGGGLVCVAIIKIHANNKIRVDHIYTNITRVKTLPDDRINTFLKDTNQFQKLDVSSSKQNLLPSFSKQNVLPSSRPDQ